MNLRKPIKLVPGDLVATVSPSHGWAGEDETIWKYRLGVTRLKELHLKVLPTPNSMKGTDYLKSNPKARAEDIEWAFSNQDVKAILCNIGGNDSIQIIPYIDRRIIQQNPKIFIGYSDSMNLHLLCYHCGLTSFYGDNLLHPIAEPQRWHPYSKKWFEKVLFDPSPIGCIDPPDDWSCDAVSYTDPNYKRTYLPNQGFLCINGSGKTTGSLFGGHTGLMELEHTSIAVTPDDFAGKILFLEDIPQFFTPEKLAEFFVWLGNAGALQKLKGIIIGKMNENSPFTDHAKSLMHVIGDTFGRWDLPVLYGLPFGHASPICVLPYGAEAEIDCENLSFTILESGVQD